MMRCWQEAVRAGWDSTAYAGVGTAGDEFARWDKLLVKASGVMKAGNYVECRNVNITAMLSS